MPRAKAERSAPGAGTVMVNRAPVLTLWAAVVAERLGYDRDEAATLGRAVAGLNAQAKGRRLGIYAAPEPGAPARKRETGPAGTVVVELLGRSVPAVRTPDGLRALDGVKPASAAGVHRYLESRLGDALAPARAAMTALARSLPKEALAARAYGLYEKFRPAVPAGQRGWGARGVLDLELVRALAKGGGARRR